MNNLEYQLNLLPYTRAELVNLVKNQVSEKRFKHILGVEQAAIMLAEQYGECTERASIAGLLHDYCKELPDSDFIAAIEKYHLDGNLKTWNNNIWHGMVGVYIIREQLALKDETILHAIEIHTTGAAQMSALDKILYVADYIELGRDFPGVQSAREIAEKSLDDAVAFETAHTLSYLIEQRLAIYPLTIATYNRYCAGKKQE
ncbi:MULTISPECIES: bis(5'-nucleosyl)-tetraphosphatase (symmetrical) YqeK [unclassified Enterococcus]|uniref:bis(5'-nucleosyl)-tetraphosphatase (symmetrical) YqeK n=1 Tax=unclassified Enterococcus TaxID=2608891 RepID=UPI001557803B|nr:MULTISPECIES: bis(5'-nucleosyl)-tetraphosphatase (symmetrical) YqeK [unclassified Enterococcus]MBS7576698.1 bis(5'-nucleosyl)-tetraphosphatase (symmetrical) YqeK [Enterococcus sp. MMGLQ5-2]MBS7583815.1 bis(5'-nucleosyl)-tetraphosphatase (symmetrical) YqeK [Enterococcus sp. MMGLQ5-1]NPD11676.1 HD domain-containing protein [Enterococcus sp. MMGLQ5-1]NPD36535.1 HD domain-containing protein [Enterococcus sp. MMGLQ5-2]